MAVQDKDTLKSYFETGDSPTEQNFDDLIDSLAHVDEAPHSNFAGGSVPGTGDDADDGYAIGSVWMYGRDVYRCFSATPGAAVWRKINQGVFMPIDGSSSDMSNLEAYAQEQYNAGQPLYFYDPNNYGFVLSGLTATAIYSKLPWIGVTNNNNQTPTIKFSGTSTLLVGTGIRGLRFLIANGATLTLQGFGLHTMIDLSEISFDTGSTATLLLLQSCNVTVARVDCASGITNKTLRIGDRSRLLAQNISFNHSSCPIEIDANSVVETLIGKGVVKVGYASAATKNQAHLRFCSWTTNPVEVHGTNCIVTGSGANITVQNTAVNAVLLGVNTVTDNGTNTKTL